MTTRQQTSLIFIFLAVIGFLFYVAYRQEKKVLAPVENITIKQPAEVDTSKYNSDKGK